MIIRDVVDIKKSNLMRLANKYKNLSGRSVSVGIHKKDNKTYPDSDVTTAEVGLWQEFGHMARGGRSFILPKMWLRIFKILNAERKDLLEQIIIALRDNDNIEKALDEIGAYMKERIKDRILSNEVTPHSKKDGTTHVDTGQLVNSIDCEVH